MNMNINISPATLNDWNQVNQLQLQSQLDLNQTSNPTYRSEMEQKGFLLGEYSFQEYQSHIKDIFLLAKIEQKLVGYIRISHQMEFRDNQQKKWVNDQEKIEYYHPPHAEIGAIVISTKFSGQGIATMLLSKAIEKLQPEHSSLYSIIAIAPILNKPSLQFHQKNNFKKVSSGSPSQLFGFLNYQSELLKLRLVT